MPETAPPIWYVYLLRCGDGTFYTGITTDPQRRLAEHRAGTGAKYTRGRSPLDLVYLEPCGSRGDATRRERSLRRQSHPDKERLCERHSVPLHLLNTTEGAVHD